MTEEKMIIKKYSNRRLYDTHNSKYINLEDLTAFIRSGKDFVVIDAKTKEDITKVILTQIIMEEEKNKKSILPLEFLKQLIKYRDEALHDFFQRFLSTQYRDLHECAEGNGRQDAFTHRALMDR